MPFHTTCFEIYKRVSQLRLGRIDINGLVAWHRIDSQYVSPRFWKEFPRHAAVKRGESQWWQHHSGDEFLAANPIFVPSLQNILASAISEDPSFSPQNGAFPDVACTGLGRKQASRATAVSDPFLRLPRELLSCIQDYLPSRSIADLRLVSRAFSQLPISMFHRLICEEMPYMFEAWSDDHISKWTKLHPLDFKEEREGNEKLQLELDVYRDAIRNEMPEILQMWLDAEPSYRDLVPYQEPVAITETMTRLPPKRTNWYILYREIVKHWKDLQGLQNRERIWASCEEIVRRMEKYREEGQITD